MTWADEPVRILRTYNRLMREHGLPERRMYKTTAKEITELLRRFGAWCDQRGVDPERFIYARHQAIAWKRRVKLEQLASDAYLARFREWSEDWVAHSMEQEQLVSGTENDTPRDGSALIVLWERMKAIYQLNKTVCMSASDMTGGYNPRSSWCQECSEASACREAHARS